MKALRVCRLKLNFISTDMMCRGKSVFRGWFGQFNLIVSMAHFLLIWRLFENSFAEQSISERGSPSAAWKAKPDTPFKGPHIVSQDLRPLVLLTALPAV